MLVQALSVNTLPHNGLVNQFQSWNAGYVIKDHQKGYKGC